MPDPSEHGQPQMEFVARQPIFDRRVEVAGYELFFRDRSGGSASHPLPLEATARTIVAAFTEIGIEAIVGQRPAYVNATRDFLVGEHAHVLPPSRVVIQVPEDVALEPDVLEALTALSHSGYRVVLDEFVWHDDFAPALEIAHGVKIDVAERSDAELRFLVDLVAPFGIDMIAENVETYDELDRCRRLGFTHFQGQFLARPHVVSGRSVSVDSLSKMQLVALLQNETTEIEEVDAVISRDVGLSMRLLRYLNSAYFYLPRRVNSIHDAIVILGPRAMRRWATLLVLADIDERPSELVVTAMVRAKMCELLAAASGVVDPDSAFTVGLFSVVDSILEIPMQTLVEELPFSLPVQRALVEGAGELGELLRCVAAYETGDFVDVLRRSAEDAPLLDAYLEAIGWADRSRAELAA